MLHYLRKIRQKLIKQENVRKYIWYAVGEILLVMIGILLALQVNNWNEIRKENNREQSYLLRLNENLRDDLQRIEGRIEFFKQIRNYGLESLYFLEEGKTPDQDNWDIVLALFQSSQIWPMILSSSTYEELKSAGELSLIENEELRAKMAQYYGEQINQYENTMGMHPKYRELIRGVIPLNIQEIIWEKCHEITELDWQVLKSCESDAEPEILIQVLERASQKEEILESLRFWMSTLKVGTDIIEQQKDLGKEIMQIINRELEK